MERTTLVIPRLRQVVRSVPGLLAPPTWIDDSDFDIDRHVRRVALPEPADERALLDLATIIAADPFDRIRPLWQFTLVEGLRGGRAALIQKMHHTIADGERGVQLSLEFLDFERDAAPPPMPDPDTIAAVEDDADDDAAEVVRDLLAAAFRLPIGVVRQMRELLDNPEPDPRGWCSRDRHAPQRRTASWVTPTKHGARCGPTGRLGGISKSRPRRSDRRRTHRRRSAAPSTPRSSRSPPRRSAGTTSSSGPRSMRCGASMAISTRSDGSGANAFSLVRMLVPTGEMPIDERFRAIQAATDDAVEQSRSASLDALAAFASTLPTSIVTRLARQQARTVDFATSNVKGSPVAMYLAGAKLLSNFAVGPLSGVAFNLTLLSYLGRLDMGLNTDSAAVSEPALLRRFIEEAVDDLVRCAD